jgi:hypothetical protein
MLLVTTLEALVSGIPVLEEVATGVAAARNSGTALISRSKVPMGSHQQQA